MQASFCSVTAWRNWSLHRGDCSDNAQDYSWSYPPAGTYLLRGLWVYDQRTRSKEHPRKINPRTDVISKSSGKNLWRAARDKYWLSFVVGFHYHASESRPCQPSGWGDYQGNWQHYEDQRSCMFVDRQLFLSTDWSNLPWYAIHVSGYKSDDLRGCGSRGLETPHLNH